MTRPSAVDYGMKSHPVLLLPRLALPLVSLHLQVEGGQRTVRVAQLLTQRRLF